MRSLRLKNYSSGLWTRRRQAAAVPEKLHVFCRRADESVSVLAFKPLVGFVGAVAGKDFLFRVEGQQRSHRDRVFFQVNFVLNQMFHGSVKRGEVVVQRLNVPENLSRLSDGNFVVFAQIVTGVRQMRQGRRKMSNAGWRVEAGGVAGNTALMKFSK